MESGVLQCRDRAPALPLVPKLARIRTITFEDSQPVEGTTSRGVRARRCDASRLGSERGSVPTPATDQESGQPDDPQHDAPTSPENDNEDAMAVRRLLSPDFERAPPSVHSIPGRGEHHVPLKPHDPELQNRRDTLSLEAETIEASLSRSVSPCAVKWSEENARQLAAPSALRTPTKVTAGDSASGSSLRPPYA